MTAALLGCTSSFSLALLSSSAYAETLVYDGNVALLNLTPGWLPAPGHGVVASANFNNSVVVNYEAGAIGMVDPDWSCPLELVRLES